jgi:1,2-phenylacetyl-CoA epoxidase catalytic subunit
MEMLQKAINKWLPRGLEMFGDERGGGTNVRFGLKPMKNAEAQDQYYEEVRKVVRDLNTRYLRARLPDLDGETSAEEASRELPVLRRIAGSCPCSKSVRWVVDRPEGGNGGPSVAV